MRINKKARKRIVAMGERRKGVTIPEIMDQFEASWYSAHRAVKKLMAEEKLYKIPDRKRRRDLLFERAGRGADIYKADSKETSWDNSQNSRARRSSRAKSPSRR